MRLKNYAPAGNQILLEIKEVTRGTIITLKPEADRIMKILKTGPTVTALNNMTNEKVKPGDYVMVNSNPMPQLDFDIDPNDSESKSIVALQTNDFNILAFYLPDKDEKTFFTPGAPKVDLESSREMKVIDNPGIDKSLYLKEERDNQVHLNSTIKLN